MAFLLIWLRGGISNLLSQISNFSEAIENDLIKLL